LSTPPLGLTSPPIFLNREGIYNAVISAKKREAPRRGEPIKKRSQTVRGQTVKEEARKIRKRETNDSDGVQPNEAKYSG
jgi:hypothetical protein